LLTELGLLVIDGLLSVELIKSGPYRLIDEGRTGGSQSFTPSLERCGPGSKKAATDLLLIIVFDDS